MGMSEAIVGKNFWVVWFLSRLSIQEPEEKIAACIQLPSNVMRSMLKTCQKLSVMEYPQIMKMQPKLYTI